jgi:hypothetical protein
MKLLLHASVVIALIVGMGLYTQLDAQSVGTTSSGMSVEQSGAAPPKADASTRNAAPVFTSAGTTNAEGIYATNRKALEQRAGKDAAKLLLQSVPSGAMAYMDGTFVGRTPLELIVPPGKYKVEMRGKLEEFGESLVGLLPNETQKLTLELALHYPAKILAR